MVVMTLPVATPGGCVQVRLYRICGSRGLVRSGVVGSRGRIGAVRSRACSLGFLVYAQHHSRLRRVQVQPDDISGASCVKCTSGDTLNSCVRYGFNSKVLHTPTRTNATPRQPQPWTASTNAWHFWVFRSGSSPPARTPPHRHRRAAAQNAKRRQGPPNPNSANLRLHFDAVAALHPNRPAISTSASPSAAANTILLRSTNA